MGYSATHPTDIARQIHELLAVDALRNVPHVLSNLMNAKRCVIWKPSRHLASTKVNEERCPTRLYPYSSDFPEERGIEHAGIPLEIEKDTTGRFYRSGKQSEIINDFSVSDRESMGADFMREEELFRVCMARFTMSEEDGGHFAVSVYRRADQHEFTEKEAATLEVLAGFLPTLYQKLISVRLKDAVGKANDVLRPRCKRLEDAQQPLDQLSKILAGYFHIKEVSVFLRDPFSGGDHFHCYGSTVKDKLKKQSYKACKSDGLTGYVLTTGERIWFHDLHNFDNETVMEIIKSRHEGICRTDGARFAELAKAMFELRPNAHPLPLSFLAVPIFGEDGATIGVLRASLGINPFHFLGEQMKVFEIIASEIGRWWGSIIDTVEQKRRGDVWKATNNSMSAQQNYLRGSDDMDGLCRTVVESITAEPGFELACFRRGREPQSLKVSAVSRKKVGNDAAVIPFLREYEVTQGDVIPMPAIIQHPDRSRGFVIPVIERSGGELCGEEGSLFVGLARVVSFPVIIKTVLYGVLDIGIKDDRDYTPAKERIIEYGTILARQLALFERITEGMSEVEKAQENEIKTYAAVTHQLKTPLFTASLRLKALTLINPNNWIAEYSKTLLKASGMVRKARNVTNMIEILGLLVAGKQIKAKNMTKVYPQSARLLCTEVAQNAFFLVDERMDTNFFLKPETWGYTPLLRWDSDLAEQCLDAVINNAFKYSAPSHRITIHGIAEGKRYVIRVTNAGPYHISKSETLDCLTPYWRGTKARARDGVGIGLWITAALMQAQGGEIKVHPTNSSDETMIELRFAID